MREDRDTHVAFHHEAPEVDKGVVTDRCVLHAELVGDLLVPPARAELMYQTTVTGHSDTFRLRIVDQGKGK